MKRTLFILTFIFISNISFSQKLKLFYQDEKEKNISYSSYNNKLNSELFYSTATNFNYSLIKGIKFKEVYGQLDMSQKSKLNKIYAKKFNIDTTKTWLIHYLNSLPNTATLPKTTGLYLFNEFGGKMEEEIKSRYFYHFAEDSLLVSYKSYPGYSKRILLDYKDYKKISLQENKKYSKLERVELVHFFDLNKGYSQEDIKSEKLFHDKDLTLKKIFNKNINDNYHIIVIHPTGEYYKVYSREIFKEKERKLLKYKTFKRLEKIWKRKIDKLN